METIHRTTAYGRAEMTGTVLNGRVQPLPSPYVVSSTPVTETRAKAPKLLARIREALHARHYSRRTEETYCQWVRRFIFFHNVRHPAEQGRHFIELGLPFSTERLDEDEDFGNTLPSIVGRCINGNNSPHYSLREG